VVSVTFGHFSPRKTNPITCRIEGWVDHRASVDSVTKKIAFVPGNWTPVIQILCFVHRAYYYPFKSNQQMHKLLIHIYICVCMYIYIYLLINIFFIFTLDCGTIQLFDVSSACAF
jgi:hypothetical protein